jgi:hypothetical protein
MARSYNEILMDLKDGKKPDYDEVRFACLQASYMLFFAERDVENLLKPKRLPLIENMIKGNMEGRLKSRNKPPLEYLGNKYNPDTEECQKHMAQSKKIYENFLKYQAEKEAKQNAEKTEV